jgi:hypothetical protein
MHLDISNLDHFFHTQHTIQVDAIAICYCIGLVHQTKEHCVYRVFAIVLLHFY